MIRFVSILAMLITVTAALIALPACDDAGTEGEGEGE